MSRAMPPDRLPAAYHPIWDALHAADVAGPGRQVLARRLGVATHTLQRILVSGDVPDFHAGASAHAERAWCRTLARLAHHLGHDPRAWIETVGIAWGPRADAAVRELATEGTAHRADERGDLVTRLRETGGPVRVGVIDYHHLDADLPGREESFLRTYVRRLLGAIDPGWPIEFVRADVPGLLGGLVRRRSPFHLVASLFDTVPRRARGVDFVPIPGIVVRHAALLVSGVDDGRPVPEWPDVATSGDPAVLAYVYRDQAADVHLTTQCGLESRQLVRRRPVDGDEIIDELVRLADHHPDRRVLFVNEEETCARLLETLHAHPDHGARFVAHELPGDPDRFPRYDLCLGLPAGQPRWRSLLETATRHELLGNAAEPTARLYADLAARAAAFHARPGVVPARARSTWAPVAFPGAELRFRRTYARHLRERLEEALTDEHDVPGWAHCLTPFPWREESMPPCPSCGGILGRGVAPGESCASCEGAERATNPREAVKALLAAELRRWTPGLGGDEARRRAAAIQAGMPTWADRPDDGTPSPP